MSKENSYIAVAMNTDDETLWDDHFGEAPCFHIYDRSGQFVEKRDNPYWQADHKFHTGPKRVTELLSECGVFIAKSLGHPQVLSDKFGVEPFITTESTIEAAIQAYIQH